MHYLTSRGLDMARALDAPYAAHQKPNLVVFNDICVLCAFQINSTKERKEAKYQNETSYNSSYRTTHTPS